MKRVSKITIIAILLLLAMWVYNYVFTDLSSKEQRLFARYFLKSIGEFQTLNFEPYNKFFEKLEKENSETYFKVKNLSIPESEESYGIEGTLRSDVKNKRKSGNIKINPISNVFINATILTDETQIGIKLENLYDKYLVLENRDLKKFFTAFVDDEKILDKIPNKIDTIQVEEFSKDEQKQVEKLKNKYLFKLLLLLRETDCTVEEFVEAEINGEIELVDKHELKINEKKLVTEITNITKQVLEDESGLNILRKVSSEELIDNIKKLNQEYIDKIGNIDENAEISIVIYVKEREPVKTDLLSQYGQISYEIENEKEKSFINLSIKPNNQENLPSNIIFSVTNIGTSKSSELTFKYQFLYEDESLNQMDTWIINSNVYDEKMNLTIFSNFLNITSEIKFNEDIEVQEFSEQDIEIINDFTKVDLDVLKQKMAVNAFLSENKNPNSTIIDIFSSVITEFELPDTSNVLESVKEQLPDVSNVLEDIKENLPDGPIELNKRLPSIPKVKMQF